MNTLKSEKPMDRVLDVLEKITKVAGFLALVIVLAVTVQVISRQGFNYFVRWIFPLIQQSFAVLLLIGGVFVTAKGMHIRVTVLSDHFGKVTRVVFKIISLLCMSIFMGVMIWQTAWMGMNSFQNKETMNGIYKFVPMYPIKILIPVISILVFVFGLIHVFRTWDEK